MEHLDQGLVESLYQATQGARALPASELPKFSIFDDILILKFCGQARLNIPDLPEGLARFSRRQLYDRKRSFTCRLTDYYLHALLCQLPRVANPKLKYLKITNGQLGVFDIEKDARADRLSRAPSPRPTKRAKREPSAETDAHC